MNRIDGKIAIITGGTQGLGEAIARKFSECGAKGIVICGRNSEKGNNVVRSIMEQSNTKVHFIASDLEKIDAVQQIIPQADEKFGRVDILVLSLIHI